jgi:biotin-(acetyl-CoA carboxylase) ligase
LSLAGQHPVIVVARPQAPGRGRPGRSRTRR